MHGSMFNFEIILLVVVDIHDVLVLAIIQFHP